MSVSFKIEKRIFTENRDTTQQRIRGFTVEAPTPKVRGQLSPENCMKIKEMEPRGEYVPGGSLGSANVNDLTKAYLIQQSH